MLDYNKNSNRSNVIFRRILLSKFFLIFLFIILLIFLTSTARIFIKSRRIYLERGETEKKLENLKIEREELQSRISELEKESGVERELIKKFQIRKPGEQVLVVLEPMTKDQRLTTDFHLHV